MTRWPHIFSGAMIVSALLNSYSVKASEVPQMLTDVAYGADIDQKMDVYFPAKDGKPHPMLVMVHGGAWRIGDKDTSRIVANKGKHYLAKGYVFVSINYRLSGVTPLEQADDVVNAVKFAEFNAVEWGADPTQVVLMGHSAGAHLVGLLSANPPHMTYPWKAAVLLDSAALDVPTIMRGPHFRLYDHVFGDNKGLWNDASPYHQLRVGAAPMLLVCSIKRDTSCAQARSFADRATEIGVETEVLPVDLSHGEINSTLGEVNDYTRKVDAFLNTVL